MMAKQPPGLTPVTMVQTFTTIKVMHNTNTQETDASKKAVHTKEMVHTGLLATHILALMVVLEDGRWNRGRSTRN